MDEFPALGSPGPIRISGFKSKANFTGTSPRQQTAPIHSESLKELAKSLEEGDGFDTLTNDAPNVQPHSTVLGGSCDADEHLKPDSSSKKTSKIKKKTKFVPLDLEHESEGHKKTKEHSRVSKNSVNKEDPLSLRQYLTNRKFLASCNETTKREKNTTCDLDRGLADADGGITVDRKAGSFDRFNTLKPVNTMKPVSEGGSDSKDIIYQRDPLPPRMQPVWLYANSDSISKSPKIVETGRTLSNQVTPLQNPKTASSSNERKTKQNPSGDLKKGKKHKNVMKPVPNEMLGFKTRRQPNHSKPNPREKDTSQILVPSVGKQRRRKQKEKREIVIPTIQSDESDDTDATYSDTYRWVHNEPGDRDLDFDSIKVLDRKPPSVIGLTLARCRDALTELMEDKEADFNEIFELVSVISKGCSCHVVEKSGLQIIVSLQKNNVMMTFLRALCQQINESIHSVDSSDLQCFFTDVINILHVQKVTSFGNDPTILPRLILMTWVKRWKDVLGDYYGILVCELQTQKEIKAEASAAAVVLSDEDFRKVPIMPTNDDINPHMKPRLKHNKVQGSYEDVDDYLDTQFRLLREDFIQPLREGISEYQNIMHQRDKRALRLYQNVKVKRVICSENGIVYRLQFDMARFSHVDWSNTKRLMYGSMVCISSDKFVTVRFATVSDRKTERLQQGKVDVKFDGKVKLDPKTSFAMVETPALFEAYRHILLGLQNIEGGHLAFQRYFVECQNSVVTPKYLSGEYSPYYDFESLTTESRYPALTSSDESSDESCELYCPPKIIDILSEKSWPTAERLELDDSQFRAFHTALTKELAIIQGPPGTGKTYVGLKIMKALLNNRQAWNPNGSKPLLVVCYTNHALDQFLEGIVFFFKGKVLRVGGRSKSETMMKYNINRRRLDLYRSYNLDGDIKDIMDIRQELRNDFTVYQREIETYGQQIDATSTGILHEDQLKPFMKQRYFMQIKKQAKNAQSALLEWLDVKGIGKPKSRDKSQEKDKDTKENPDLSEEEEEDEIQKQRKVDDVDEFLQEQTTNLRFLRGQCLAISLADCDMSDKDWKMKYQNNMKRASRQILKARIRKSILMVSKMDEEEVEKVKDVLSLTLEDRWRLYRYWVDQFCQKLQHLMEPLKTECQNAAERYREANGLVDKYIFENSAVIGLTTTGAARYHSILNDIQPPVIVVEEAAEVLEGHIVTSLSPGCQHLILIGDHQQLRPSPNVYELAQQYNLDLSLFERMINNGLHCDTLELQHRMRPSISRIMRHIYKNLKDHDSVQSYDDVMGVAENIYFINHNVPETENIELLSHLNTFEAEYLTKLCQYLLKQGYNQNQITVLSTYSAQVSRLRSLMREETYAGIHITAVDNYQGEENDIILLSLVRSNKENKIGFLKIDNRICVALSRARKGLYVIGNFDLLSSESPTWKNIVQDLKRSNQLGPGLELYCQTHPEDKRVIVTEPKMFCRVPEGGCMKACEFVLNCGHICRKYCHVYDPMHEAYYCLEPCQKTCPAGHPCPGKCSEECGPCDFSVPKTIPGCGHMEQVPCHLDPMDHKCQHACDDILECGHKCGNICGYDHICYDSVRKEWPCGHEGDVLCIDKDTALCQSQCSVLLQCGHVCQGSCQECTEGRLHIPCKERCRKILICGHECTSTCSRCPPCTMQCETACPHRKCSKKSCGARCEPCLEPCQWSCAHSKCRKKCSEPCDRPRCDKRCRKQLKCKHTCIGLCGEICPMYCRICNADDIKSFLPVEDDLSTARFIHLEDCDHIVEVKTLDSTIDSLQNQNCIQLPSCSWCTTPIRRNGRYGKILKRILGNLEFAKATNENVIMNRVEELRMRLDDDLEVLESSSELLQYAGREEARLTALKNQTEVLLRLEEMEKRYSDLLTDGNELANELVPDLKNFRKWLQIKRNVFTDQEALDAQSELHRITAAFLLEVISRSTHDEGESAFLEEVNQMKTLITDKRRFTDERLGKVLKLRMKWIQIHPERGGEFGGLMQKVPRWKSNSMENEQWFPCPNSEDHVYSSLDMDDSVGAGCPVCTSERYCDHLEDSSEK